MVLQVTLLYFKVDIEVERDPNRLLQPTAGWRNRARDKTSGGGQVLHMPHRSVHRIRIYNI